MDDPSFPRDSDIPTIVKDDDATFESAVAGNRGPKPKRKVKTFTETSTEQNIDWERFLREIELTLQVERLKHAEILKILPF